MTIEILEDSVVHTMWMVEGNGMDILAILSKRHPDEPWRLQMRTRFYRDARAHHSNDHKHWVEGDVMPGYDVATLAADTTKRMRVLAKVIGGKLHAVPVNGGAADLMRVLRDKKWAHFKLPD